MVGCSIGGGRNVLSEVVPGEGAVVNSELVVSNALALVDELEVEVLLLAGELSVEHLVVVLSAGLDLLDNLVGAGESDVVEVLERISQLDGDDLLLEVLNLVGVVNVDIVGVDARYNLDSG